MSKLRKEIKLYMLKLRDDGSVLTAHFCFAPEFIGFKGHFPGKPVLPGVCKIQAVLCMLEAATKKVPKLKEIVSAKFFAPVTCNEEIVFAVRKAPGDNEDSRVSALVTHGDKKISEIQLKIVFEDREVL